MIDKDDIVLYNNKKYKVDNVKFRNGKQLLKIHSVRGKVNEVIYNIPSEYVTKICEKED